MQKTKYKYKVILYAHALYLVRIDGSHEWEVVSVAQIDGTLSATLTNDNSVMVHWAGADRYEVACDDFAELAEHIEDAHTAHLNRRWSRRRKRTRSIAIQRNPFWSPLSKEKRVSGHSLAHMLSSNSNGSNGSANSPHSTRGGMMRHTSGRNNMRHNLAQLSMSEMLHSPRGK